MAAGRARSIAVVGNAAEVLPELLKRGVIPDVVTDQTSAHDPVHGYLPPGWSVADWLTGQDTTYRSRYLRHVLGEAQWPTFRARALAALEAAVPNPVDCVDEALFAVGTKPGGNRRDRP